MNDKFLFNANQYISELKNTKIQNVLMPKVKMLYGGSAYFQTLYDTIDNAQQYIWISNYTLENDNTTQVYFDKLSEALKRGVKVYFFYDYLVSKPCPKSIEHIESLGGYVFKRNRRGFFEGGYFMRTYFQRDHQKLVMADNKLLIGSSNFSKDYGGKKFGQKFFKDINVLVENVQLRKASAFFELLLSKTQNEDQRIKKNYDKFKIDKSKIKESPFSYKFNFAFCFHPIQTEIQPSLISRINNARKSIKIIQAYYVPVKEFDNAIFKAHERGVKVQFITAAKRDVDCYSHLYNQQLFKKYIKKGISVYEYDRRFLHAKVFFIDDDYISIGSFNTDLYSWVGNNELQMEIYDQKEQSKKFQKIWKLCKKQSKQVEYNYLYLHQRLLQKFWMFFQFGIDRLMVRSHFYRKFLEPKFRDNVYENEEINQFKNLNFL